jgi:plastocyanin
MYTEEESTGAPRGLLLTLGVIGILLGGAIAGEFVLRLQPGLSTGTAVAGSVIMPQGVGANTGLTFSPATIILVIGVNNTVTFKNQDTSAQYHTVTATDNSFNSGDLKFGQSWTYTFNTAGTFTYYCIYHSWMKGTVIVKSSSSTGTGGGFTVRIPAGTGSDNSLNYSPSAMTLVVGINNTVTFINQDSTKHTVTASDSSFDSGDILPGGSWTHTFAPGNYSYHCIYHTYMKGTIRVISA